MASLLHEAEQQGILDVHLALVTYMDRAAVRLADADQKPHVNRSETSVGHWRRLDGSDPDIQEDFAEWRNADAILQVPIAAVQEVLGVSADLQAIV